MAFLNGFYDLYSQYLRMFYDFLNTACNTNYFVFIIYFVTSINFIISIYEIVVSFVGYYRLKSNSSFGSNKPNVYKSKKYKENNSGDKKEND